jgi:hypothetical protein
MRRTGNRESGTGNITRLARVFFGRLFENDMFSSSSAASSSVTWLLALVATPGVMFSGSELFRWAHLRAMGVRLDDPLVVDSALISSQAFHLDFVMAVSGIVTMMVWGSLTPDRRDALVLGTLPITHREQAYGRLLALLKFFALFIVAVSVPTALAFNFVSMGPSSIFEFPARVLAHVAAATLAGGTVFFSLLTAQLVLAAIFGPRAIRFVTLPLQLAALAGIVLALASTEGFARAMLREGADTSALRWNPAAWFAGTYRWLYGDDRAIFTALAMRGLAAGLGIIGLALVMYPLAYGRCLNNVIVSEGRRMGATSRWWATFAARLLRPVLRAPLQRGIAAFMIATLGRSQTHRFLLGLYAGLAFLLSLPLAPRVMQAPTSGEMQYAWFAIPLGYVFWAVCGLRVALMMPVEPVANWIFKLTEPVDKGRVMTTVVTVMMAIAVVPFALLFSGTLLLLGEQRLALTVLVVVLLQGLCLVELLTLTMKNVPFSCTYLPGQLKLRIYWAPFFVLWLNAVFTLSNWSLWTLQSWGNTATLAAFLLAIWIALRVWHLAKARKIGRFVYDEQEPASLTTMEISAMMKHV